MRQVALSYRTGGLEVLDVPHPALLPDTVLVRTARSVVSAGTEKLMTELAKKTLLGKALARPDQVRRVVEKVRTDGLVEAYQQASRRLDTPVPLGYSCAGTIVAVGDGATGLAPGGRVACGGPGFAAHAEIVRVPKTLCVRVPDGVETEAAAFVALGAIALHGVRTAAASLGERVAVIGLGLLGQITVQILKASGCSVFGADIAAAKVALARQLGADAGAVIGDEDVVAAVSRFTCGTGADAVLILAGTPSSDPIVLAGDISRDRGRIVAVGAVGLDIPRNDFFEKELSVVVSRSSGPGFRDPSYEEKGSDYPIQHVRWTEGRNMEAFLHLMARGAVEVAPLVTHRFPLERAVDAYDLLWGKTKGPYLGILLTYPEGTSPGMEATSVRLRSAPIRARTDIAGVGVIGAGQFMNGTLLPELRRLAGVRLRGIATATGLTARHAGRRFGFEYCSADFKEILADESIRAVLIGTRHNLHAPLVVEALRAGKAVFVEKPLATTEEGLREIVAAYRDAEDPLLFVGFNRRHSRFARLARDWMDAAPGSRIVHCRVNAGVVPAASWVHDPVEGGGRIVGEVCHFIDLVQFLTGAAPVEAHAVAISPDGRFGPEDNLSISLRMSDGSVGTISYVASGDRGFPRERVEIFGGGAACAIENFRSITFARGGRRRRERARLRPDRGYRTELAAFVAAARGTAPAPDPEAYVATTLATFAVGISLRTGEPASVVRPSDWGAGMP